MCPLFPAVVTTPAVVTVMVLPTLALRTRRGELHSCSVTAGCSAPDGAAVPQAVEFARGKAAAQALTSRLRGAGHLQAHKGHETSCLHFLAMSGAPAVQ